MPGQKTIYVYDSFSGNEDVLLGYLYVELVRGVESYSFEYDQKWLNSIDPFVSIDPSLQGFSGRQFSVDGKLFGAFEDSSPDRWGRTLMNRRERQRAKHEDRKPRKLNESDYLLGVHDETRMGGLRFKTKENGPFVSEDEKNPVPPWVRLRTLEEAVRRFENEATEISDKWMANLIQPGSSLGGARPKANVRDESGELWIAKFPSKHDDSDAGAWEKIVWDMANMCGLNVPEAKLEKFSKYGSTFLSKRFDRKGNRRLHYASAMTLLRKKDGASASDGTGYLDIVDFIRSHGGRPKDDLKELWSRIVFGMAVSNTDDHLRNHAFMYGRNGWTISPMFDVNPVPYGNELALNVSENENSISIGLAIETSVRFGIDKTQAEKMAKDIVKTVNSNWEKLADQYGLSRVQIEYMRPAFSLKV